MNRNPDGARLVGKSARNRLPYPPCGVSREFESFPIIEFFHRARKADIAFLHQVKQTQIRRPVRVALGDGNHQPEIRFHQPLARFFVAFQNLFREVFFFVFGQQRGSADFFQIHLHRVRRAFFKLGYSFKLFFADFGGLGKVD